MQLSGFGLGVQPASRVSWISLGVNFRFRKLRFHS